MKRRYSVDVEIDEEQAIITVTSTAKHLDGEPLRSWMTAWVPTDNTGRTPWIYRIHPTEKHEVATYDDRDQAIGEIMTSLRDGIDQDDRYRARA